MRVVFLAFAAILGTISCSRADSKCSDPAVLAVYSEVMKCQVFSRCSASDPYANSSKELDGLSEDEVKSRVYKKFLRDTAQTDARNYPNREGVGRFISTIGASTLIGWRDAFRTMKVGATPIDYDPNRRRYTCRGQISFSDTALLHEALRRQSLSTAAQYDKMLLLIVSQIGANGDPTPILRGMAKPIEMNLDNCLT
jgi:hypothetical protein